MTPNNYQIDSDAARVQNEIDTLAAFSEAPAPAVTRVLWTPTDVEARSWLKSRFTEAGLAVRDDALGNTFARWEGSRPHLAPVATGSHTDAIPHSGRYDGTVGVLGALEAFRALRASGWRPTRSLELMVFTAEEPTRFGLGCLGSRALSGAWSADKLRALRDNDGVFLDEARRAAGFEEPLESVPLAPNTYHAFVELHIEQGPILERTGVPIGIVTAIAAPATLRVVLTGEGGHAGAVLMPDRRDALVAAAAITLAVEKAAHDSGAPDTVATVGVLRVHPGAVNSVPSRVEMEIDIRDTDLRRRDQAVHTIQTAITTLCAERRILADCEVLNADPPAVCAPEIVAAMEASAHEQGLASSRLVSRAYHDTLFMARIAPVGMLFIPCRGGVSHRPDEYSTPEQIAQGIAALAGTLVRLSEDAG